MFFYKETAFGFGCSFWLHQRGIPRRTWRLYCSLRGHQRVGTAGFANPSFATEPRKRGSLDSNSSTRGFRCGGDIIAAAGLGQYCMLNSGAIAHPQFGIWCSCLCTGRYRTRFSRFCWVLGRSFFIIGGITVRSCGYMRFLLCLFVEFALTAVGSIVLVENGMENQLFRILNRTNALYNMVLPSLIGEMDLHPTKL